MNRFLCFVLGTLVFLLLDACAASAPGGAPCESCRYGYRRISRRHGEPTVTCVVDGNVVDCKKTAAECPECARRTLDQKHD